MNTLWSVAGAGSTKFFDSRSHFINRQSTARIVEPRNAGIRNHPRIKDGRVGIVGNPGIVEVFFCPLCGPLNCYEPDQATKPSCCIHRDVQYALRQPATRSVVQGPIGPYKRGELAGLIQRRSVRSNGKFSMTSEITSTVSRQPAGCRKAPPMHTLRTNGCPLSHERQSLRGPRIPKITKRYRSNK